MKSCWLFLVAHAACGSAAPFAPVVGVDSADSGATLGADSAPVETAALPDADDSAADSGGDGLALADLARIPDAQVAELTATGDVAADAPCAGETTADSASAPAPCTVPALGAGTCINVAQCTGVATPGFCAGPKDIQCCTPASTAAICDPNAKPQPNSTLGAEPAGQGGCPAGMAKVSQGLPPINQSVPKPFCIDRWEAALQDQVGGNWQESSPYWNPGAASVRAVSRPNQVPAGYISGKQAAAACKLAAKRLCTDAEWLRACKGPVGTTFPYGPTLQPKVCNDSRAVHPAVEYFGTAADWIWSKLGHPCINQLPKSVAKTQTNVGCVSAEGLYDLMGNLHEWTADPAGTFRGGFYVDTKLNGPGCLYATTAHDMGHWDYSTGFRCCADSN